MMSVDLNCDLGEGAGHDEELMPLISSANIACGGHAGDETTMRATVLLAKEHGVAIGAHPGFADRENFGRIELEVSPLEIRGLVLNQVQHLLAIALQCNARVRHVKPHGALYNMAVRDREVAQAVADAVYEADPRLLLVCLAGSQLLEAGAACGLSTIAEAFGDRTYRADGSLTPRSEPGALITDEKAAAAQGVRLVREGKVSASDGSEVSLSAETICLHGDGEQAVAFAVSLRSALQGAGLEIKSFAV